MSTGIRADGALPTDLPKHIRPEGSAKLPAGNTGPAVAAEDGLPMQPVPSVPWWIRLLKKIVPVTVYGVVSLEAEGAQYKLVCSSTTTYVLRNPILNFKRYEGKKVMVKGYICKFGTGSKLALWAVRIIPLESAGGRM